MFTDISTKLLKDPFEIDQMINKFEQMTLNILKYNEPEEEVNVKQEDVVVEEESEESEEKKLFKIAIIGGTEQIGQKIVDFALKDR